MEERGHWTGWTTSSPDGSACSAVSSLGSMISSESWSASLSATAMGWGAGSGKFSTSNAGKLSSAPTSRSMFLYTAAPVVGATTLPRNKSAKKLLNRFPSHKAGQAEANTKGKGGGCSISKWRTPAARHGHVSLLCALASTTTLHSSCDDEDVTFLVKRTDVRHCRDGTTEINATFAVADVNTRPLLEGMLEHGPRRPLWEVVMLPFATVITPPEKTCIGP